MNIHRYSGMLIALFVGLHLANHAISIAGAEQHIQTMQTLRVYYRHPVAEALLLLAVLVQVASGIRLFWRSRKRDFLDTFTARLQRYSGLYLAVFFMIHLGAVMAGRHLLHLDTNFYFGVAGLNTFPFNLFFVPYYTLAILSFFAHIAAVHQKKMKENFWGLSPNKQSIAIFSLGLLLTGLILYGLTNQFKGVTIPKNYNVLIGK